MTPISSGSHPGIPQNCLASGLLIAAFRTRTAGTLWIVFLVASDWYLWHLLHHPRLVVSRSTLALRICEKELLGTLAFRETIF